MLPPAAVAVGADDSIAAAGRAMRHIEVIAAQPHPLGSAANLEVRNYLMDELAALGLEPIAQVATAPDFYGAPGGSVEVANVMARIPGTASTGAIVLVAHYDSMPTTPGANDNAASVAALLETARVLVGEDQLRNDIIILATDAEEPAGRFGANTFVNDHPWAADVAVAINFEAAGGSGPALLVEAPSPNRWLIDAYRDSTPRPVAYSFLPDIVSALGEVGTDFDVFRARGTPGLHFAYVHGAPIYHTMDDNLDAVGLSSLQHHCDHAYALATTLGDFDLGAAPPKDDLVFFTAGPWLVTYPTGFAAFTPLLPIAALGAAVLVVRRRRRLRLGRVIGASLRTLGGSIGAAVAAAAIWTAFTSIRSTPGVIESYGYLGVLVVLAGVVIAAAHRIGRAAANETERAFAIVGLWSAFALIAGVLAPATGYLFVWPALAATITLGAGALLAPSRPWQRAAAATIVAVPTMVLMVPAIDIFLQFAMPRPGNPDSELPAVIAVAILLAGLTIELLRIAVVDTTATDEGVSQPSHGAEIPLQ